jgi:two-component system LytT family sensor kinase
MNTKKRYRFWKVFWVMLGIYCIFGLIGVVAISLVPHEADTAVSLISWIMLVKLVVSLAFSTVFYYFTVNRYYEYLVEKRKFIPFLQLSLLAMLFSGGYHVLSYFIFPMKNQEKYATFPIFVFGVIINTLIFIGLSFLVAYLTKLRDDQKQNKILQEQKMQLEVEKSQANLNFLKAQINPHFLHNTLNFLYAKSLPYSPELSEGILTLSDIMRYALGEASTKDGKAPLKDEIEHVRNVIKINQLRFSNNLNVHFEVNGVVNGATIIPFVLITLVENAFKHGDLKNSENPITINLSVQGNQLFFTSRNKKKAGPKEISTGVGLDNIKKRLELAYGNRYSFNVKEDADFYTTELTISQL